MIAIYELYNTNLDLFYIGQTCNLKNRFKFHLGNKPWCIGIRVLEWVENNEWGISERKWITKYIKDGKKLTNRTKGGQGSGPKSEDTRRKIGDANKGSKNYWFGKTLPIKVREKISQANTGKIRTIEMKLHLSKMCSGWKHSELAKEKISNKLKGVPKPPITEKTRMKMKMSQQKRWSLKTN